MITQKHELEYMHLYLPSGTEICKLGDNRRRQIGSGSQGLD